MISFNGRPSVNCARSLTITNIVNRAPLLNPTHLNVAGEELFNFALYPPNEYKDFAA
jgi:hypothetical protein